MLSGDDPAAISYMDLYELSVSLRKATERHEQASDEVTTELGVTHALSELRRINARLVDDVSDAYGSIESKRAARVKAQEERLERIIADTLKDIL